MKRPASRSYLPSPGAQELRSPARMVQATDISDSNVVSNSTDWIRDRPGEAKDDFHHIDRGPTMRAKPNDRDPADHHFHEVLRRVVVAQLGGQQHHDAAEGTVRSEGPEGLPPRKKILQLN